MKAFLVGLGFLFFCILLWAIGILLYPFFLLLTLMLRLALFVILGIWLIWLLGKLIIVLGKSLK